MSVDREAQRQQRLLQTLWRDVGDAGPGDLVAWTRDGPHFQRGLQAYQAHASALAARALAAAYPTVVQLLGDASFGALARAFWRHSPPDCGDLGLWGAGLHAFLAAAPDLAEEPYLGDLARLEWAVHSAATAADSTAAPFGLQHLAEADATQMHLVPQAGTALVDSTHPIVSIWQAHRLHAMADEPVDGPLHERADERTGDAADEAANRRFAPVRAAFAAQRAEPALVWRQGWRVQVAALGDAEARFTHRVLQGQALGAALQATAAEAAAGTATEPGFDFQRWLLLQLQRGWLAGVGPAEGQR